MTHTFVPFTHCSNPTSNIKYLYIYFTKGEDRLIVSVDDGEKNDECKRHLNGQYHSPESSVWRILSLKTNRQCEVLMISYPGKEYIRFNPSSGVEEVRPPMHNRTFFSCM